MPEKPKQIEWHPLLLLADDSSEAGGDAEKLKASLEYRRHSELSPAKTLEELGTAEHRPHHGLIYDAPLGLKF